MATISLSPAQHQARNTPNRRVPLGINHNAVNSPLQGPAASKRSRDQIEAQEEFPWNSQPHAKRPALEAHFQTRRTSPRKQVLQHAEARVFTKKSGNIEPTNFERQLLAARDNRPQQRMERQEKSTNQNLRSIKQWQEHYKRAFPQFVFYFEGLSEDGRIRCSKYARSLGAVSHIQFELMVYL